jgi:hypothetical protein
MILKEIHKLHMKNILSFYCLAIILLCFACTSNKDASKVDTQNCQTLATVKDFTGLDGCGLMIVLDNGDKLLPNTISDPNFTLREGQRIKINYKELEDMMSVCMAEKAIVEITCIELIEGKPVVKECYDAIDVTSVPWMDEVVKTTRPSMVKKYPFRTDGWAYLFITADKELFYDCQGLLLCTREGENGEACLKRYVPGEEGRIIYSVRQ